MRNIEFTMLLLLLANLLSNLGDLSPSIAAHWGNETETSIWMTAIYFGCPKIDTTLVKTWVRAIELARERQAHLCERRRSCCIAPRGSRRSRGPTSRTLSRQWLPPPRELARDGS